SRMMVSSHCARMTLCLEDERAGPVPTGGRPFLSRTAGRSDVCEVAGFRQRMVQRRGDDRIQQAGKAAVKVVATQGYQAVGAADLRARDAGLAQLAEVIA